MGLDRLDHQVIKRINPGFGGYFVELGANDGVRQSNTYKLQYSYGWTGLLIEPNPTSCISCLKNRSFGQKPQIICAACVPFDYGEKYVELIEADLMSIAINLTVNNNAAANHAEEGISIFSDSATKFRYGSHAKTLTSILDDCHAPKVFDFLSLDVEGNESSVLSGLDFNKYRPKWILVEVKDQDCDTHHILEHNSYQLEASLNRRHSLADYLYRSTI